jgi:hypothetical protein
MEFVMCEDGGMAEVRFHTKQKIGFKAPDLSGAREQLSSASLISVV